MMMMMIRIIRKKMNAIIRVNIIITITMKTMRVAGKNYNENDQSNKRNRSKHNNNNKVKNNQNSKNDNNNYKNNNQCNDDRKVIMTPMIMMMTT